MEEEINAAFSERDLLCVISMFVYVKQKKNQMLSNGFVLFVFLPPDDSMDCVDNERRPHFPQFSYSASGTA